MAKDALGSRAPRKPTTRLHVEACGRRLEGTSGWMSRAAKGYRVGKNARRCLFSCGLGP
jgi:hypothetical protein